MRTKFFAIVLVTVTTFVGLVPSYAGDYENRQRRQNNEAAALMLGIIAGAIIGGAIADNNDREYRRPRPRYYDQSRRYFGNGYVPQPRFGNGYNRPPQYGGYQPRRPIRNPEGGWLYQGGGQVMRDGMYCQGRLQYNPNNGRYYCVR